MTYKFKLTTEMSELIQILQLQSLNLKKSLSSGEIKNEGFVTVSHDFSTLHAMHSEAPHAIAKLNNEVVGYALAMHPDLRKHIPILEPMFLKIEEHLAVNDMESDYLVMGQICIDKSQRKRGVFKKLYQILQNAYADQYSRIITEISTKNERSLLAHKSIGFEKLVDYKDATDSWRIVYWDWQ